MSTVSADDFKHLKTQNLAKTCPTQEQKLAQKATSRSLI